MIHVTQGDERGIGLEVFLMAFIRLSSSEQKKIKLWCSKKDLLSLLELSRYEYEVQGENLFFSLPSTEKNQLLCSFITEEGIFSHTLRSILDALSVIQLNPQEHTLLNLPSMKDQFFYEGRHYLGHTEFYRSYFKRELTMLFKHQNLMVALLTDHWPLAQVSSFFQHKSKENISFLRHRLQEAYDFFALREKKSLEIYLAGLNPHAGENNLMGNGEEEILSSALSSFAPQSPYPPHKLIGPIGADSMLINFEKKDDKNEEQAALFSQLFCYCYHDQALGPFKALSRLEGVQFTAGLPFTRLSPDHGTANNLRGTFKASSQGVYQSLLEALYQEASYGT